LVIFNKTIAYVKSWKHTLWIALLLGLLVAFVLIMFEPFDTDDAEFAYKELKLLGYALCIIVPILSVHFFENKIYEKQRKRWFVLNELVYLIVLFFLILSSSFLYHFFVIGSFGQLNWGELFGFMKNFGLPFLPILIPLWLYLRSNFGTIEIPGYQEKSSTEITITGENKTEKLTFLESDFVFAQAQQNYMELHCLKGKELEKTIIRSTLSNLMKQLPNAWQVHRSYLVNLDHFKTLEGNARKRYLTLGYGLAPIPISKKYYEALQKRLSKSSQ